MPSRITYAWVEPTLDKSHREPPISKWYNSKWVRKNIPTIRYVIIWGIPFLIFRSKELLGDKVLASIGLVLYENYIDLENAYNVLAEQARELEREKINILKRYDEDIS